MRIADNAGELIDNRRGEPELLATPALALAAMVEAAGNRAAATSTGAGPTGCGADIASARAARRPTAARRRQRRQDPSRRASSTPSRELADPDYIAIADGGDLLSFARVGLRARTYMDAGAFGCLGVGVPYRRRRRARLPRTGR